MLGYLPLSPGRLGRGAPGRSSYEWLWDVMNTASLNGIELAFEDIGHGSRVLLLIHGHPFDHMMWQLDSPDAPMAQPTKIVAGCSSLSFSAWIIAAAS